MSIGFLWIQVKKHNDSTIHLMQPQLINSILKDLHLQDSSNNEDLLALSTRILHKNSEGGDTKQEFHYQVSSASFIFQKILPGQILHMLFTNAPDSPLHPRRVMQKP